LGCWTDTGDRAIPTLEDLGYSDLDGDYGSRADSIAKCENVAKSQGKFYVYKINFIGIRYSFYRYSF
jgi:hypothetical protein